MTCRMHFISNCQWIRFRLYIPCVRLRHCTNCISVFFKNRSRCYRLAIPAAEILRLLGKFPVSLFSEWLSLVRNRELTCCQQLLLTLFYNNRQCVIFCFKSSEQFLLRKWSTNGKFQYSGLVSIMLRVGRNCYSEVLEIIHLWDDCNC